MYLSKRKSGLYSQSMRNREESVVAADEESELELTHEEMVCHAFEWYCDIVIDALVNLGFDEDSALDTLFSASTILSEDGTMPEFPEEGALAHQVGEWLVKAKDENFLEFVLESVQDHG